MKREHLARLSPAIDDALEAGLGRRGGKRKNKYGSRWVEIDGIRFQSKAEGDRYAVLKLEERAGVIRALRWQVVFPLRAWSPSLPQGVVVGEYRADFAYERKVQRGWIPVVEDVKSAATAAKETWPRTQKLFFANYGHAIVEIRKSGRRR